MRGTKRASVVLVGALILAAALPGSADAASVRECGVVPGPVALYEVRATVPCPRAKRVGRQWRRRVVAGHCTRPLHRALQARGQAN